MNRSDDTAAIQLVDSVLAKYIDAQPQEFKQIDFTDLPLKFKVVRDCMQASGIPVSNADLTNIIDYATLVECMSGKWMTEKQLSTCNDFRARDPVKETLANLPLPSNLYFNLE